MAGGSGRLCGTARGRLGRRPDAGPPRRRTARPLQDSPRGRFRRRPAAQRARQGPALPPEGTSEGVLMRFAVLGMLEFIDWGGGDILYYASRYITQALESERYAAPAIVERNMHEGRIGESFLDYANLEVDAYRRERLAAFVAMLGQLGLARLPVVDE